MIRPQPRRFIPGMAACMPKNTADRLMAMIASHRSAGKSSMLATCWMPALLTRMSTAPSVFSASAIMPAIWSGLDMSAGL